MVPLAHQPGHVPPELVGRGPFGRGPDDQAVARGPDVVQDLAQAPALVVAQPLGDAVGVAVGDQHHEPPGQGHLLGEPGALGPDRVLGDLADDVLAGAQQLLDAGIAGHAAEPAPGRLGVIGRRAVDLLVVVAKVAPVEHGVFGGPDVDERGLHAGQHVLDPAQVDVAVDLGGVVGGPAHVVLDERPALEHGDLGGGGTDVDDHEVTAQRPVAALDVDAATPRLGLGVASLCVGGRRYPPGAPPPGARWPGPRRPGAPPPGASGPCLSKAAGEWASGPTSPGAVRRRRGTASPERRHRRHRPGSTRRLVGRGHSLGPRATVLAHPALGRGRGRTGAGVPDPRLDHHGGGDDGGRNLSRRGPLPPGQARERRAASGSASSRSGALAAVDQHDGGASPPTPATGTPAPALGCLIVFYELV